MAGNPVLSTFETKLEQGNPISVTLNEQNENPFASRTVQSAIDGAFFANVTTGGGGQASFNWQPINTGNYTVAASYSTTGSIDTGYMPASASTVVNVKPQTIINTQTTGSGTQSVTFNAAQGVAQTPHGLSFSMSLPSWNSVVMSLQFGLTTAQGNANISNQLGLNCVARILGACVLWLPSWNALENIGVGSSHATVNMPILSLSLPTISLSLQGQSQVSTNLPAFGEGVFAGGATMFLLSLPLSLAKDAVSANLAAAILLVGAGVLIPFMYLAALAYPDKADRLAYALGFLLGSIGEVGGSEVVGMLAGIDEATFWPQVRVALLFAIGFALMWGAMFFSLFYAMPG